MKYFKVTIISCLILIVAIAFIVIFYNKKSTFNDVINNIPLFNKESVKDSNKNNENENIKALENNKEEDFAGEIDISLEDEFVDLPQIEDIKENIITEIKTIKSGYITGSVDESKMLLYNQYISTGNVSKNVGYIDRALEYYENALLLHKSDLLAMYIANIYLEKDSPNLALKIIIENNVINSKLLSGLIIKMINLKYQQASYNLLRYANTLNKSSYILFANGYYFQSKGKYSNAIKYYEEALEIYPPYITSAYYAGLCYEEIGDIDSAIDVYRYIINSNQSSKNLKYEATLRLNKLGN